MIEPNEVAIITNKLDSLQQEVHALAIQMIQVADAVTSQTEKCSIRVTAFQHDIKDASNKIERIDRKIDNGPTSIMPQLAEVQRKQAVNGANWKWAAGIASVIAVVLTPMIEFVFNWLQKIL